MTGAVRHRVHHNTSNVGVTYTARKDAPPFVGAAPHNNELQRVARLLPEQAPLLIEARLRVKRIASLGLAIGFVVSTSVWADTITIRYDNPVWAPLGYDSISISTDGGLHSRTVPASRQQATVVPPGLVGSVLTEEQLVDDLDDLFAYCYDLAQYIHHGQTLTYEIDETRPTARTRDFLGAVNYVLNGSSPGGDEYAWLHPTGVNATSMAAAIQIGIWESLYDASGWSLTAGTFRASGLDAGTLAQWTAFRTAVLDAAVPDLPLGSVMALTSPLYQDQIVGRREIVELHKVDEPGSLALAAMAAVAAMALRRRQRA